MSEMVYDEKKYKQILLDTFKAFITFCKENNITYYVAGGTMLGAVRHQAMIPWDDDVDVYLRRDDYERLLTLKSKVPVPYSIVDWDTPDYPQPFAKWTNTNTTVWEVEETPSVYGVFVDLFPLDEFDDRELALRLKRKFDRQIYLVRHSLHVWTLQMVKTALRQGKITDLLTMLRDTLYYKNKKAYYIQQEKLLNAKIIQLQQKGGRWLIASSGVYKPEKEIYDAEWFKETTELPFEDFTVSVPANYDAYLTCHYGNYMQLPPENERVQCHKKCFVDLQRGYTIQEIKELLSEKHEYHLYN